MTKAELILEVKRLERINTRLKQEVERYKKKDTDNFCRQVPECTCGNCR